MLMPRIKLFPNAALLIVLLFTGFQAISQTVVVRGTVVNSADNQPLAGISVGVQGARRGTTTDNNGMFAISVNGSKAMLVFSSVGFQPYTLNWAGTPNVVVKLEPAVAALQDVVVVGYGVQKKINQTGST